MGHPIFALLGAIGLFSLTSGFLTIDDGIRDWLNAWKSITRPVWDFLLGYLFAWIGWTVPNWLKDYLTLGVIFGSMRFRAQRIMIRNDGEITHKFWYRYSEQARDIIRDIHRKKPIKEHVWKWLVSIIFWPRQILTDFFIHRFLIMPRLKMLQPIDEVAAEAKAMNMASFREYWQTYFSTFVWFAILISLNYALLFDWLS